MLRATVDAINFIGLILEGFLYGLYSGIFAMYLQYQASKKDTTMSQNIVFHSICALYVLSVALFACDMATCLCQFLGKPMDSLLKISFIRMTSFAFSDCIAQFILIYRCWIVWGHDIRVVIIPSILAFAFLATWLASGGSVHLMSDKIVEPSWASSMPVAGLALSLIVNALVTGLIVLKILKVFREVKANSDDQGLGATGGSKLRHIIFILVESGMALFSIQFVRLVISIRVTRTAMRRFNIIMTVHEILNGIIPTTTLVRTSMGLSFHDEKSMEEVAIESLRFAPNHPNSISEIGSVSIAGQESRDDDIGDRRSRTSMLGRDQP